MARGSANVAEVIRIVGGAALLMLGLGIGAMRAYLVFVEGEPPPETALGAVAAVVVPIGLTFLGWRSVHKVPRFRSR